MANELKHASVGTELTQAEWEAIAAHICDAQAIGDMIYASTVSQFRRLGIGANGDSLQVVAGLPAWVTGPRITSGNYTGNNGAARAIAHGLGITPKYVFITDLYAANYFHRLYYPNLIAWLNATEMGYHNLGGGTWDATNFFVGDGTNHARTANASTINYYWVALA